jgi:hypothetical protein
MKVMEFLQKEKEKTLPSLRSFLYIYVKKIVLMVVCSYQHIRVYAHTCIYRKLRNEGNVFHFTRSNLSLPCRVINYPRKRNVLMHRKPYNCLTLSLFHNLYKYFIWSNLGEKYRLGGVFHLAIKNHFLEVD